MPILDDGRWEKYAQLLAAGEMSDVDAHEAAGFKRIRGNACRLKANESIQARVQELKEAGAERAEITREYILKRIQGLADILSDWVRIRGWGDRQGLMSSEGL
ncbi:MAG: hypothetical protein AAF950_17760 [Pseudomonadota bacterium]